ncbi:MAG: helix-turn-helix domain-containing protein [Limnochordales bacterium]|nr:helix-turn-helix domain-containing protein [Limnochordales bacterium]
MNIARDGDEPIKQRLLRIREVAIYLGVSESFVKNAILRGEIPAVRIGRTLRVDKQDLDKIIVTHKKGVAV